MTHFGIIQDSSDLLKSSHLHSQVVNALNVLRVANFWRESGTPGW